MKFASIIPTTLAVLSFTSIFVSAAPASDASSASLGDYKSIKQGGYDRIEDIVKIVAASAPGTRWGNTLMPIDFVKGMITAFEKNRPLENYIVIHSKHEAKLKGKKDLGWLKTHYEVPLKPAAIHIGPLKTKGYDIYVFTDGEFTLQGKGGLDNFAYSGNVTSGNTAGSSAKKNGNHLVFAPRKGNTAVVIPKGHGTAP